MRFRMPAVRVIERTHPQGSETQLNSHMSFELFEPTRFAIFEVMIWGEMFENIF